MSEVSTLLRLYEHHQRRPFPRELKGREIDGECLVLLDSLAAGCIAGFFSGREGFRLDPQRVQLLESVAVSLARICPQLADEHRPYFDSVRRLAERISNYCRRTELTQSQ